MNGELSRARGEFLTGVRRFLFVIRVFFLEKTRFIKKNTNHSWYK